MFNNWPYTNLNELNLDWILQQVKGIQDKYQDLDSAIAAGVEAVQQQEETSLQDLDNMKLTIVTAIHGAKDIAILDMNATKTNAINDITTAQGTAESAIAADKTAAQTAIETDKTNALAAIAALGNTWDDHYESLIAEMPADLASLTQTLAILGRILTGESEQTVTFFMGDYAGGSKTTPTPAAVSDVSTDMIIGGAGLRFRFALDDSADADTKIYAIRWFEGKNSSTGIYTGEHVVNLGNVRAQYWTVPDTCYGFSITLRNSVTLFTEPPSSDIATLRWNTTYSDFVSVDGDQNFNHVQKAQGRENIGAASEEDYAELESTLESTFDAITAINSEQVNATIESAYMNREGELASGGVHLALSVNAGDRYSIRCSSGSSVSPYVLISSGTVIDYYSTSEPYGTQHNYDVVYTVTADGTLYINSISDRFIGVKRLTLECANGEESRNNTNILANISSVIPSPNLFDRTQYNLGYRQQPSITSNSDYAYSKPIFLEAGTYLYTSVKGVIGGSDVVYLVDEYGNLVGTSNSYYITPTEIGTVSQNSKYNNRTINAFTLAADSYVSINLGYVKKASKTSPQISNFMLVRGTTLSDFPQYSVGYGNDKFLKNNVVNGLSGLFYKTAIFDGDSISEGNTVGSLTEPTYGYGWAGRIGNANYMAWINNSVGGGVITSASNPALTGRHSVVDDIDSIHESYPDIDYYIFEGGTNDADLLGNAITDPSILGTFSETDFTGPYNTNTFTGAMETICFKAIQYWKKSHIGYIVAPKMGLRSTAWDANTVNKRAYFERAIQVCKKWGIPVINLWDGCYLNPSNPSCYDSSLDDQGNRDGGYMYTDGQHLTAKGYDYISPMIEAWMKTL